MAAGMPRWFDSSAARPPAELAEALNIHTRLTKRPHTRQRHRRRVSSPQSQISTATPRAILVPLCGADDRGALDGDLSERAMRGLVVVRHALRLPRKCCVHDVTRQDAIAQ